MSLNCIIEADDIGIVTGLKARGKGENILGGEVFMKHSENFTVTARLILPSILNLLRTVQDEECSETMFQKAMGLIGDLLLT